MLHLLIGQIQKDYLRAGVPDPFGGKKADAFSLPELFAALREHMYLLLMESFDQHLTLMYAADVPERAYRGLEATDAVEAAGHLTGIILKREWEKVKWRNRYDGSGPPRNIP
jgi:hypothetical protein